MKQITCSFCGDTYPDFDVAHVCNKGPERPELKPKINERILSPQLLKLVQEAGPGYSLANPEWIKKFAALLVQECASICDRQARSGWNDDRKAQARLDRDLIKEHFGVEE